MNTTIDVNGVTAVRLGDGWHEGVTDFAFFGDGQSISITQAGATWREPNGCRFSCPLPSILAIREGVLPPVDASPRARTSDKLQDAMQWLQNALEDGLPHAIAVLKADAKGEAAISSDTLDRAWKAIGARSYRRMGVWCWEAVPVNETDLVADDEPRQSSLIDFDGAE